MWTQADINSTSVRESILDQIHQSDYVIQQNRLDMRKIFESILHKVVNVVSILLTFKYGPRNILNIKYWEYCTFISLHTISKDFFSSSVLSLTCYIQSVYTLCLTVLFTIKLLCAFLLWYSLKGCDFHLFGFAVYDMKCAATALSGGEFISIIFIIFYCI